MNLQDSFIWLAWLLLLLTFYEAYLYLAWLFLFRYAVQQIQDSGLGPNKRQASKEKVRAPHQLSPSMACHFGPNRIYSWAGEWEENGVRPRLTLARVRPHLRCRSAAI